jgi:transcriptional repressor NrdR
VRCPFCGDEDNRVVDSRLSKDAEEIRRRRECDECGRRFTTRERLETGLLRVIKRDERREDYDRSKLLLGIEAACVKRPVSADAVERLLDRVEKSVHEGGEKEVTSRSLGELTLGELTELDQLAGVRFASVFYNFQSGEDYTEFFEKISRSETAEAPGRREAPEAQDERSKSK